MSNINLDELLAQRAEATGSEKGRVPFEFKGENYTFRDPLAMTDEEKEELAELDWEPDIAEWYMGEEQYEKFLKNGGNSTMFFVAFIENSRRNQEVTDEGKPALNRSSRRMADRKRRKQR